MVRLGVGAMGGEVGGYGTHLGIKTIHPHFKTVQPSFETVHSPIKTVDFLAQHLMTFDNDVQFVLKILR
jgi:hypothetical protein